VMLFRARKKLKAMLKSEFWIKNFELWLPIEKSNNVCVLVLRK
jgi:hypothetical protein